MSRAVKPTAVLFDFYNTLLDIRTDEHDPTVWQHLATFLSYQGGQVDGPWLHGAFFEHLAAMQRTSGERYPEIDMVEIAADVLRQVGVTSTAISAVAFTQLLRALSLRRFRRFDDALPALSTLRQHYQLGLISDAQRVFLEPEMVRAGFTDLFDVRIVSSDYGYRKPDARLFARALAALGVAAHEAVYVGDSLFRDVVGAHGAGMRAVLMQRHAPHDEDRIDHHPDYVCRSMQELIAWLAP